MTTKTKKMPKEIIKIAENNIWFKHHGFTPETFIEAVGIRSRLNDSIRKYLRSPTCEIVCAIRKYVIDKGNQQENGLFEIPDNMCVSSYMDINCKDISLQFDAPDKVVLQFEYEVWDEIYDKEHTRNQWILVPKSLITNFTDKNFATWIKAKEKVYYEKQREKDMSLLKKLQKKLGIK